MAVMPRNTCWRTSQMRWPIWCVLQRPPPELPAAIQSVADPLQSCSVELLTPDVGPRPEVRWELHETLANGIGEVGKDQETREKPTREETPQRQSR
eukprot:3323318-Pyramimonas_sp.AAC.1